MVENRPERFEQLEKEIMKLIAEASLSRNPEEIFRLTGLLKEIKSEREHCQDFFNSMAARLNSEIFTGISNHASFNVATRQATQKLGTQAPKSGQISPKAKGKQMRISWLKTLQAKGILLRPARGSVIYQSATQRVVGIATATERPVRPDKFFLGLPDQHYDVAVLLCEAQSGKLLDFVLPRNFLETIWKLLSRSNGQVKFHIEGNGGNFELRVPGSGFYPLNPYLSDYSPLH